MAFQLVYTSTAVRPATPADLVTLLAQARTHNAEQRITGMLLYRDRRYLQLLEGRQADVRRLYAAIETDERHRQVTVLCEGRRLFRQFPTWTMAFRDLADEPIQEPGYTALFEDAVECVEGAVDALVPRLRPSGPQGRPVVATSRVLGMFAV